MALYTQALVVHARMVWGKEKRAGGAVRRVCVNDCNLVPLAFKQLAAKKEKKQEKKEHRAGQRPGLQPLPGAPRFTLGRASAPTLN